MMNKLITVFFILAMSVFSLSGQDRKNEKNKLVFTPVVDLQATSVKNQASSGTCWCFATVSFLESELLRAGKGEYDLSEMFIVRYNYIDRLKDNFLKKGKGNTGQGGLAHDVMRVLGNRGIVPDEVYTGLNYGSATHNHYEMNHFLHSVATVPVTEKRESEQYWQIVNSILDIYLGEEPDTFLYRGQYYTPLSFADSLGIDVDDYVEITSFTQWPFYTSGHLEIPDNWVEAQYYNVPLDEMVEIVNYSLNNGYTVSWDADVSEKGFSHGEGTARLLNFKADKEYKPKGSHIKHEVEVTQEMRQQAFENFTTTDDHLMHITGMARDQFGKIYYKTKNSWGTAGSKYDGFLYVSENYFRGKTISVLVNKDGIPSEIRQKLGL